MLEQARRRIKRLCLKDVPRVRMICADALELPIDLGEFDLIVSHFFLDCFRPEQLERIIGGVASMAEAEAQWLLADFQEPAGGWKKWRARAILNLMYGFFQLTTNLPARRLTPPDPYLKACGFFLADRCESEFGLLRSDRWVSGMPPNCRPFPEKGKTVAALTNSSY
jgi:hypothetical protein